MTIINHLAIIMDGNGRWGLKKFNNRSLGHFYGAKRLKPLVNFLINQKIKNLTLYTLSYDNLRKRKKKEIINLFDMLTKYLQENINYFVKNKIKINFIGEKERLPRNIIKLISHVQKKTNFNKKVLNVNIAFNYSSKKEIINTINKLINKRKKVSNKNINNNLYTSNSGDPDILIRTGGYNRLSDFLLWQSAYTELFFLKTLWPDFKIKHLKNIFYKYNFIKKNYGS